MLYDSYSMSRTLHSMYTYPQKLLKMSTRVFWPISRLCSNPPSCIFFMVLCKRRLWTYWSIICFRHVGGSKVGTPSFAWADHVWNMPFIPTSLHFLSLQCWQTLSHSGLDIQSVSDLNRHSNVFPANTDLRKNAFFRFIRNHSVCHLKILIFEFLMSKTMARVCLAVICCLCFIGG